MPCRVSASRGLFLSTASVVICQHWPRRGLCGEDHRAICESPPSPRLFAPCPDPYQHPIQEMGRYTNKFSN
ncbi:hypothetical protein B0T20DRAFT_130552 [Sordaria brevicollis]|uniref:Uncharacterized protein n=1 Tax=Sordaria brevicollis TaxID=83679 RepID=A0AAE0PLF0_SORBR|nr:hypothetical protein B0T20DRAFT_130552 [Sordaria brevicollis]